MKLDKFNEYVAAATPNTRLTLTLLAPTPVPFPYFDVTKKVASLAVAYIGRVEEYDANTGDTSEHTVVTSFHSKEGEDEYSVWCGDTFLEGRISVSDARTRCVEAVGTLTKRSKLVEEMMKVHSKYKESERCDFWVTWRREKKLCAHTSALLAGLQNTIPDFAAQLKSAHEAATGNSSATPVGEVLSFEELAFRIPVLFEGDRGAGKTFLARGFARSNNYKLIEAGGNQGLEAPDLLGYLVPYGPGVMVWKDGPVAEAWRKAKTEKVVLLIDELLRIPEKELSLLLTALSPDETEDGPPVYRLRTGRIVNVVDGVAEEEVLEAPVENLCVTATTNIGSQYAVSELDEALAERFIPIRMDTDAAKLEAILKVVVSKKKLAKSVVKSCVDFFKKMTEARKRGLVHRTPTTRTLCRAVELATNPDDVRRAVKSQVLLWVARDSEGYPVQEQLDDVNKLIERCFGAA